ncbi:serine/threonine-protein kinase [Streptomyces odontomachi]|uniref:serine/threonine-protein kinase n=1 Tax=Streptomyces odontomachi TaxID=2944940 RepID=UPI00210AE390|nr:protein kinase [Streptomyces sp. ODS25]
MTGGQQREQIFQPLAGDDPATVAGYRLAARLGAGGMGKVYLSYTPGGRPVAIKVIRPEFAEDAEFRRRFAQEVQSAQRVQGLFTAPVIDADAEGPQPWLATAYVPGPSLANAVVTHGALPTETVLLLVAGVAEALQVIHGAHIVHRDLKPSNVLLAADGPRVIDFGIAHAADATSLTGSGVTIGTPAFMAPEQASGSRVTPATDIFALGQVAAYAAMGGPAFGEGTGHGMLYRIVHEEPDLSRLPAQLRELVTRCLAKDPAGRPSLTDILQLCQAANAETVLRRPEEWLPRPVSADITVRAAAPAPAQTPPPGYGPSAGYSPTAPASPSTPPPGYGPSVAYSPTAPASPTTPPPGYGPSAAHQPTQPAGPFPGSAPMPVPPQAQAQAYAPTQFPTQGHPPYAATQVPGAPHPQGAPGAPKSGGKSKRVALIAVVAALVFGVGVGGTVYLLKDDGKKSPQGSGATDHATHDQQSGSGGADSSESATPGGSKPDPKPAVYDGINLTAGYHLTLGDDPVRPQNGADDTDDLSYHKVGYVSVGYEGGSMVLLDPAEEGSLDTCRTDTRFTQTIEVSKLSKGRQICVTTDTGHLALVTIKGKSAEDSPSEYITLDLTVWRNAAPSGTGS